MRLLLGFDEDVARYVASRIPGMTDFGPSAAIGVIDSNHMLIGGVVFHDYQPQWRNIQVSFASDRADWLTPRLVRGILHYPFFQLQCARITCATPKRNKRARQFLAKFGFRHEGTIRKGFGDDDMILSGLMRTEWTQNRFYNGRQVSTSHSSGTGPNGARQRTNAVESDDGAGAATA